MVAPQALWTAAHYGLHTKYIVINNLGRSTYNLQLLSTPGSPLRVQLDNPPVSFRDLATSMRVPAGQISMMSELEPALQHMFETQGPFLLDVHVSDGHFEQQALDKERAASNS